MADDRTDFENARRADAAEMATDLSLQKAASELFAKSDNYNYSYLWNWLGLPIIQVPADVVALQEIIWERRPSVVVELGVARGGSLILYSSILQLIGRGRVVGVDIDIRPHNRAAIEEHPLGHRVALIQGSSLNPIVLQQVQGNIGSTDSVMIVLDSNHTHEHVLKELRMYAPLVTEGQFLVVADTILEQIPPQARRPRPWGPGNNPATALEEFLETCDRFEKESWINDKLLITNSPGGYLRRMHSDRAPGG